MRDRRAAEAAGRRAEALAALWLNLKGYRVLARRFACAQGEIDLVAARGKLIAIVEVKARADVASALAAVSPRAQGRLARAALVWLGRHADGGSGCQVRFDVIAICPGRFPVHLRDAFRPDFA